MRKIMEFPWVGPAVLLALGLSGCATAPPAAAPAIPLDDTVPEVSPAFLCHAQARRTGWDKLKIPSSLRPVDVALAEDVVHVLFSPPYVLSVPRGGGGEPRLVKPAGGVEWSALDVDPLDGSLWIASSNAYRLIHVDPQGNARSVALTGISGEGGLREIRLGRDFLYAVPVCADDAVWIFERSGRLVGSAFPAAEKLADVQADRTINTGAACARVYMGRRADGEVIALRPDDVRLYRAAGKAWEEIGGPYDLKPPGRYTSPSSLEKLRSGPLGRTAYLKDVVNGLFFYGEKPALLGDGLVDEVARTSKGTLFYRVEGQALEAIPELCSGGAVIAVDSDRDGYAAINGHELIVGGFLAGAGT